MDNQSIKLKICGITQPEQALKIASLGVNAIGVIAVKSSPRFVPPDQSGELFKKLSNAYPKTSRVLVVADINDSDCNKIIENDGSPSIIQLHGNESRQRCTELKRNFPNIQWWKAFRIKSREDVDKAKAYEGIVDALLLDTWSNLQLGGTGKRLNIEWLEDRTFKKPLWIAGGIDSTCVDEILRTISPSGIDSSSKLEISPGIKDIEKVKLLIETIKESQ